MPPDSPPYVDEDRLALFIDYENLAISAKQDLGMAAFEFKPIADALAERGRVVVRRAYADWSFFEPDRRALTRHNVELIEMPQRMGGARKNAADIKMAVDAIELAFERAFVTTFVICTGDSDFTPLVQKLRELNKRVIGVGVQATTSRLLPPACDEFLFYERLEGVHVAGRSVRSAEPHPQADGDGAAAVQGVDADALPKLIAQTVAGLQRSGVTVYASSLKRTLLRKDPTFSEADFGYRAFGELLRHLAEQKVVELNPGSTRGDPEVSLPEAGGGEDEAFALLSDTLTAAVRSGATKVPLSGLKTELRKRRPDFSEKPFGFGGFLQFCKAAGARGLITLEWDEAAGDYVVAPVTRTA